MDEESLCAELRSISRDGNLDLIDRSVLVTGVLSEALRPLGVTPVLVGGMAVLFWTSAEAFATRDIDLVMDEPPEAEQVFRSLGFELATDGRHWELAGGDVLVELPSRFLPEGAAVEHVDLGNGRSIQVLSRVDIAIVRLEELSVAPHADITLQALALLSEIREPRERARLVSRASQTNVVNLLNRLLPIADDVASGVRCLPGDGELYALVKGS